MEQFLEDAFARIQRAREHLHELKNLLYFRQEAYVRHADTVESLTRRWRYLARDLTDLLPSGWPDNNHDPTHLRLERDEVDPKLSIVIGEIIYNLRSVLDYLVYDLARFDSGELQDGTQFPIEDTVEGFAKKRKSFLKGLSDAHVIAIEKLQPYAGCAWTKTLRGLSNPDKHRRLVTLKDVAFKPIVVVYPDGGAGHPHDVEAYDFVLDITFADGTWVIDTLQALITQIAQVVKAFERDLQTHGSAALGP